MSKEPYQREAGVVIGNVEDKSNLSNPIARRLVAAFDESLLEFVRAANPSSIHEVGCGEARITGLLADHWNCSIRASDFSAALTARNEAANRRRHVSFIEKSIYDLEPCDSADLVICCEVLEHLAEPERALRRLARLEARVYIFSVPREPIWRMLNMLRGKYWRQLGNTPGHLNHWSKGGFMELIAGSGFRIKRVRTPLPWTMLTAELNPI